MTTAPSPRQPNSFSITIDSVHLYQVALILSAKWHENQKWGDEPYINHIHDVAFVVRSLTNDPVATTIALLHDCIEYQGIPVDTLYDVFGEEIADAVFLLTITDEDKAYAGGRTNAQRLSYPDLAKNPIAALVKVADRYANVVYGRSKNDMYLKEHKFFRDTLYPVTKDAGYPEYSAQSLWDEIDQVLGYEA